LPFPKNNFKSQKNLKWTGWGVVLYCPFFGSKNEILSVIPEKFTSRFKIDIELNRFKIFNNRGFENKQNSTTL
jgi:hypothetical protein